MSTAPLKLDDLTPREIVAELDKHIVGQVAAKRAVAVALRNRVRRQKLPAEIRDEVSPKNIIMIGPTGVGKTEIARRLSKLSGAPFLKVEATKYTEVGYVGRDVESMIRDLMHVAVNMVRQELQEGVRVEAERRVEEILLDLILGETPPAAAPGFPTPPAPVSPASGGSPTIMGINIGQLTSQILAGLQQSGVQTGNPAGSVSPPAPGSTVPTPPGSIPAPGIGNSGPTPASSTATPGTESDPAAQSATTAPTFTPQDTAKQKAEREALRERMRAKLREGALDAQEVEVTVSAQGNQSIEIFSGPNMEEIDLNFGNLGSIFGQGKKKKKKTSIKNARTLLLGEEMAKLVDNDRVGEIARERAENLGIVFIDEIDKIASKGGSKAGGPDVSREGVQRDILPIIEGSKVNTKYGLVDTTHILFIAAGAFHMSKPSDLIPELQGRFPIRVELEALSEDDFYRILTQPTNAITRQYAELLATEGVTIEFTEDALRSLARIAVEVNGKTENIGARRLHTIMERLLEELSFHAPDMPGQKVDITEAYVKQRLGEIVESQDLSRYIL